MKPIPSSLINLAAKSSLALVSATLLTAGARAQSVIAWTGPTANVVAGAWGDAANWSGANLPDSDTKQADLRADWSGTAPNLTLGADYTLNAILFEDTGSGTDVALTLNTGNSLTLAGTSPFIQVDSGSLFLTNTLSGGNNWSKTGAGTLVLNADNSAFTGAITVTAGTLDIRNPNALGSIAGATTVTGNTARAYFGNMVTNSTVAENLVIGYGADFLNGSSLHVGGNKTIILSGTITLADDAPIRGDGGTTFNLTNPAGITAANKSIAFVGSGNTNVTGPLDLGTGGVTKTVGGTLTLLGTNPYTGATTLTAGTIALGNATTSTGSILGTSSITVSASTLTLSNTAANADRLPDLVPVSLTLGGVLSLVHNTAADTTETIGALNLGLGSATLSVSSAASRVTSLAAASLNRGANRATALVRGTSLSQAAATNVSRITLADTAGLPLVGTNTLTNGAVSDATQALKIVPYLVGDSSATGTGNGFVTYDSTLGLRVLTAAQTTALSTGYTTATNPDNASVAANLTLTNASGIALNSLLFKTAAATLDSSTANSLIINSGAVATFGGFAYTIGSGFSSLALGNDEGVITPLSGSTLTINTPVSVTNGGGLTKAGAGTLALTAANTYSGPTFINAGTLSVSSFPNGGLPGPLGTSSSSASNLVLAGGILAYTGTSTTSDRSASLQANGTFNVSSLASTLGLTGSISGAGLLIKAGAGTLALTAANTFTGNIQINGTASGNTLRLEHPEALGSIGTAKTVNLTGSNRQVSILELANNITMDATKTISTAGKGYFASADNAFGSPVFLRNASGNNTWLGNVLIGLTGGAYSIEVADGTLTLGAPGTSSTLTQSAAADTRAFDFRGAGTAVINSKMTNNGTSLINLQKMGTGSLNLPRTDNDFIAAPNLYVGTVEVENLAASSTPSSLGAGTAMTLGATLRHVGSADSSTNRSLALARNTPAIESSGTGSLSFTNTAAATFQNGAGTTLYPFSEGQTVVTALDVHTLSPGITIVGNGIAIGTTITAVNYDTRELTLSTPTVASTTNGLTSQGGVNFNASAQTNSGQNTLQFTVANASNTRLYLGQSVSGTGIAANSVITAINTATGVITLNNNLSANVTTTSGAINFNNNVVTMTGTTGIARTLTLGGTNTGANSFAPLLNNQSPGLLSLVKAGPGLWTVNGANTFSGGTTVTGGTLVLGTATAAGTGAIALTGGTLNLNGQVITNAVSVASGGTLAGSGTAAISGNIAGTVAPGNSAGRLIATNASLVADSTAVFNMEIGGTGAANHDVIEAFGGISLAGTVNVSLINGFIPAAGDSFDLFVEDGSFSSTATLNLPALGSGLAWNTSAFATTGAISVITAAGFGSWQSDKFTAGELANVLISGPDADPDGDGLSNTLEYAFGSEPKNGNDANRRPIASLSSGALNLAYRRPVGGVPGVTYMVQINTLNLSGPTTNWTTAIPGVDYNFGTPVSHGDGTETVIINFTGTVSGKKFARIQASF